MVGEDAAKPLLGVVSGAGVLERQRRGLAPAPARSLRWLDVTFDPSVSLRSSSTRTLAVGDPFSGHAAEGGSSRARYVRAQSCFAESVVCDS